MATDLEDKQGNTTGINNPDPGQAHYDREFDHQAGAHRFDSDPESPDSIKNQEESAGGNVSSTGPPSSSADKLSPSQIRSTENSSDGSNLFRSDENGASRFQRVKGRARKIAGNKLFIGGSLIGGGGFIMIIIFAIILLGSLKIPHLMEHITGYQFARVTQQMARSTTRVTATKIVVDSADERAYNRYKAKYYSNPASKVGQQWSKLDKYRPQKLISNFDKNSSFKLVYQDTAWGKPQLVSVTVDGGRTIPVEKPTGLTRFIPGVKLANNINFASQVAPVLQTQLRANDVGFIIRGSVAKEIRQRAGISLVAWKVGQFKGKTPEQARLIQARAIYSAVSDDKVIASKTPLIGNAAEKAKAIEIANINNDEKLPGILDSKGADREVIASIDNSLKPSVLATATGVINPIYAIAAPMCIIYEGSLQESAPVINAQSEAQERLYYYMASAADQQKNGYDVEPEAVEALNKQVGDITGTNPERRAAGLPVNTANDVSVQASAGGNFSILDALLPGPVAAIGDKVAGACPVIADVKTGVAVGVLNIALVIGSFGTAAGAEATAIAAIQASTRALAQKIVTAFTNKAAAKAAAGKSSQLIGNVARSAGTTAGLTLIANLITHAKMNSVNNGLQTEEDLVHGADSGGTIAANNLGREQFFGVPFDKGEVVKDAYANQVWISDQQKQKDFSTRYIALSNPDSLLTKVAINVQSMTTLNDMVKQLVASVGSVPSLFSSMISGKTFAAESVSTVKTHYGVVQWGFTEAELNLLRNDPSYSFLDNQAALDATGQEAEIATKYAECFGYTADETTGELTPGGPKIGDLIADGKIVRDEDGDIQDGKNILCSETNLSFNNPDYGDKVFRWRVAHSDRNTIDQLTQAQEPVAPSADTATATLPSTPAGSIPGDMFGPSDTMTCPTGTQDGGVQDGYRKGVRVPIRVCIVNGIDVNAKIATNVQALIKDADSKGIKFTGGGFRTMEEQTALYNRNCGGNPGCKVPTAKPGFSNHQMGLAIDFISGGGSAICFPKRSSSCFGNAGFNYLVQNASRYGLQNLPSEAWHWSVDGS